MPTHFENLTQDQRPQGFGDWGHSVNLLGIHPCVLL